MQMRKLFAASLLACVGLLPFPARSDVPAAAPSASPPPEIYHVVTTALCARLHAQVAPAVAMILQNDQKIAKSPPLFKRYQRGTMTAIENASATNGAPPGDSIYNQSPETDMALQQMSYLVLPIARNLIAAQTMLDSEKLVAPTGNPTDDAMLRAIKAQLLETIAYQSASLDVINGFVATQQMGELQHVGEEYLGSINGTGSTATIATNTPNPWQDPNTPGLAPNPYNFDPSQIPGLTVGYNPLSKIMEGLQWLQSETQKREDTAGKTIGAALGACGK